MENKEFDLVSIGDIVTDAFIRISQASVYYDPVEHQEKICLTNGGKIPYEFAKVISGVGNSPNAAVCATRLGLKTALVTNVGDDENGRDILEALEQNGIDRTFVRVHEDKTSNYHYVLWHGTERTILIKHQKYDYVLPDIGTPRWIYLSSVGEDSLDYHRTIIDFLREHPTIRLAFQPGTYQVKIGYDTLRDVYERAEVFFCNKEEAEIILRTKDQDIADLAREIVKKGPNIAVITDGMNGAAMCDGTDTWHMTIWPDPRPDLERTGAGDSFASTFTSALALGKTPMEALEWGAVNSMNVVRYIGAQEGLLHRDELERFLGSKPEGFTIRKI